jgi:hypothetical protein
MKTTLLTLVLCATAANAVAAENLVVPVEAFELAKAHGCSQVADFYSERPGIEDPPYALIAGDFGLFQIAVWCTTDMAQPENRRSYTLLFRIDDTRHPLAKCPGEIRGVKHIGGLRFLNISEPAKEYYFVGSRKPIAAAGTLRMRRIVSSYDGTSERYVCIDGKWAFRALD